MTDEKTESKKHPVIKSLQAHRDRLGMKDAAFHRHHLRSVCSAATWSLLQSGVYTGDVDGMIAELAAPLAALNDQAEAAAARRDAGEDIVPLSHVVAALTAIKGCADEIENRLVPVLLPTGGGKTTLLRHIGDLYGGAAVPVEATETWRQSYLSPLKALCAALGIKSEFHSQGAAEAAALDALRGGARILVIDEGHYCGQQALNLVKLLLNDRRARTRVVLLAIPILWERMERAAMAEVQQLRRRTHAKIVVREVSRADARLLLRARLPGFDGLDGAGAAGAVDACVRAANRFGLYDTIARICKRARLESRDTALTPAHIDTAINHVEALRS